MDNDLIIKSKLLEWVDWLEYVGKPVYISDIKREIESGRFDYVPDPITSPTRTIRPGETIVTHKDKRMKHLGKGLVREISASGKSAYVKWESGWLSRYSLDKLEVIESD